MAPIPLVAGLAGGFFAYSVAEALGLWVATPGRADAHEALVPAVVAKRPSVLVSHCDRLVAFAVEALFRPCLARTPSAEKPAKRLAMSVLARRELALSAVHPGASVASTRPCVASQTDGSSVLLPNHSVRPPPLVRSARGTDISFHTAPFRVFYCRATTPLRKAPAFTRSTPLPFTQHSNILQNVRMLYTRNMKTAQQLERHLKGVANHWRIEILYTIDKHDGLTLDQVAQEVGGNLKTIAVHTQKLVQAGLVNKKYRGRAVAHSLSPYGKRMLKLLLSF